MARSRQVSGVRETRLLRSKWRGQETEPGQRDCGADCESVGKNHPLPTATAPVLDPIIHCLVEAMDGTALSRGVQGFAVRVARALNRLWRRVGRVFADRFHAHILRTPKEVRVALLYVLRNERHHGIWLAGLRPDPFSSGARFNGWRAFVASAKELRWTIALPEPRTWLLSVGWRRHGELGLDESPAPG